MCTQLGYVCLNIALYSPVSQRVSVTLKGLSAPSVTRTVGSANVAPTWSDATATSAPPPPSCLDHRAAGVSFISSFSSFNFNLVLKCSFIHFVVKSTY